MWFGVLGPLMVAPDGGEPAAVSAPRLRVVLAALLAEANCPVSVDVLADLIWDGTPPPGAATTVRNYVLRLRRMLGAPGNATIVTQAPGYLLRAGEPEVDALAFEALCRQAGTAIGAGDWPRATTAAAGALELWRGTPLADVPCQPLRDRWVPHLEQLHAQVGEWQCRAELHLGHHELLIPRLRDLAARHPLREDFYALLMLALARAGRRGDALAAYQDARQVLVGELGVEPGPELRDLHQRILAGDLDLLADRTSASLVGAMAGYATAPGDEPAAGGVPVAGGVPRRLPADTRVFTGRLGELARLLELGEAAGGVPGPGTVVISAIDGMAGVGKTALVVHAAHRLAERFGGGQFFIDLHGYTQGYPPRTAGQALEMFLRTLGISPRQIPDDVEERAALYRELLAGTRTLIVLDNAADEAQVRPLIPGDGGCLVLVTSRRKLKGLDDADNLPLDVLPEPDAVALFCAIAGPGRAAADDPAVAAVIGLCGRLPLAVRIAAALLRNRPAWRVEDLAERLRAERTRLAVFADGDRDLAAIFDLSSQYLDDGQRRLYRCLGLILGCLEIDAYAAAALVSTDPVTAERQLQDLVDHNLLLEPARGRYRMHDLILAHAQAAAGPAAEQEAAIGRLLDYYQHTAGRADARIARYTRPRPAGPAPAHAPALPDPGAARAWLRAERANLTAALRYAVESGRDEHTVTLAAGLASLLRTDGPWPEATVLHTAAAAAAGRLGNRPGQARALTELGNLRRLTSDYEGADRDLRAALDLYRDTGDKLGQAHALAELGIVRRLTSDYPGAGQGLRAALDLYGVVEDKSGQAHALIEIGVVQCTSGDYAGACHSLRAALDLSREIDDMSNQARALTELVDAQTLTGDYEGAARSGEAALAICEELGDRLVQANARTVLGRMRRLTGDYQGAARHQQAAIDLYRELGDRLGQANARTLLAEVRCLTGDHQGSARDLEESIDIYRDLGNRGNQAWALNYYAAAISAAGDLARAAALYRDALHLAREVRQPDDEATALHGLGETRLREGKLDDGTACLSQALEIYQRLGMPAAGQVTARLTEIRPR